VTIKVNARDEKKQESEKGLESKSASKFRREEGHIRTRKSRIQKAKRDLKQEERV